MTKKDENNIKFDIELMNPKADPDRYVFEFSLIHPNRGTLVFRLDKSEYKQLGSTIEQAVVYQEDRLDVAWSIEDVKSLRPKWTDEACEEVLDSAWSSLEEQAIVAGWEVLEWNVHLLDDKFGGDEEDEDEEDEEDEDELVCDEEAHRKAMGYLNEEEE